MVGVMKLIVFIRKRQWSSERIMRNHSCEFTIRGLIDHSFGVMRVSFEVCGSTKVYIYGESLVFEFFCFNHVRGQFFFLVYTIRHVQP